MAHRINIMLDDENWKRLQEIPAGERSRLINESLSQELLRRQRLAAIERMDQLRAMGTHCGLSSEELIRQDRESH